MKRNFTLKSIMNLNSVWYKPLGLAKQSIYSFNPQLFLAAKNIFLLFVLLSFQLFANAQTSCGAGFVKTTNFLPNGNYATLPTQDGSDPMNGNAGNNPYDPAVYTATDWGNFVFVSGKYYLNNGGLPLDGGFNFVTGNYTDNSGSLTNFRSQRAFAGDAANSVPATPSMMIWNGNPFSGNTAPNNQIIVYQRNLTGLTIGKTYTFWYYSSNALESSFPDMPMMRILTGGSTGKPDGTVVAGPLTLTNAISNDNQPLNGWVRQAYTFTANNTTLLIKVTDGSTGVNGDDLALTAFGIDSCQSSSAGPLPLTIISFTGKAVNKNTITSWTVADAINVSHFELLASKDGIHFKSKAVVSFINGIAEYTFTDVHPLPGFNYYQLKIHDKDGKFNYSNIIKVKFDGEDERVNVYPNPVTNFVNISFGDIGAGAYDIEILDAAGKQVKRFEKINIKNYEVFKIERGTLTPGVYLLRITNSGNQFSLVRKMIFK